ncbi:AMP-binding enzyme, putative [Beauveria bassiana ARSEF 2860]|uniref:AMP-binding enzyme, putative n=1 Tax=Beauveria bassiana (strain ARSEF 2860) TaxID=655819 RepID=J4KP26_BEAB2|nr:AMP-binding enzyme, putative [Beauveria bassiana ARSEF 2860]EJP66719.1 AMP-binding enzyme, putative [Beauveria bassiana ARSEF 2860]
MTSLRISQGQNGIINLASLYRCPEFHSRVIAPPCRYLRSLSTGTYSFHLSLYIPGPTFVKQVELVTAIHAAGLKWLFVALEFLDLALATVEGLSLPPGMVVVFDPPGLDSYTGAQPSLSGLMDGADESDKARLKTTYSINNKPDGSNENGSRQMEGRNGNEQPV